MFRADWDRRAGVRLPLTLPGATATAGALSPNGAFAGSVEGSYVQLAESSTGSVRRIQLPKEADSQHLAIKND